MKRDESKRASRLFIPSIQGIRVSVIFAYTQRDLNFKNPYPANSRVSACENGEIYEYRRFESRDDTFSAPFCNPFTVTYIRDLVENEMPAFQV